MKLEFAFQTTDEIDVVAKALLEYAGRADLDKSSEAYICIRELYGKLITLKWDAEAELRSRLDDGIPF